MRTLVVKESGQGLLEVALILAIITGVVVGGVLLVRERFTENPVADSVAVLDGPARDDPKEVTTDSTKADTNQTIKFLKYVILTACLLAGILAKILSASPARRSKGRRRNKNSWQSRGW